MQPKPDGVPAPLRRPTAAQIRRATEVKESIVQGYLRQRCMQRNYGYCHTHDSRGTDPGFLDTVMVGPGGIIWAECKRAGKKPTAHQVTWMQMLEFLGQTVRLYYPEDMHPRPEYGGKSRIEYDLDTIGPRAAGRSWPDAIAAGIRAIFTHRARKRAANVTDWRKAPGGQPVNAPDWGRRSST